MMLKGMVMRVTAVLGVAIAGVCTFCHAANADRSVTFGGRAAIESGQIVSGHFHSKANPWRLWMNHGYLNFSMRSTLSEKFSMIAEPEVRIWFNNYPFHTDYIGGDHTGLPFRQYSTVSLAQAVGTYSFFGNDNPILTLGAGVFPIKYNMDANNLGEYLFRSGAYVPYLMTGFEYQFARLSGLHLSSMYLPGLHLFASDISLKQEVMLYTETQVQPLHDWSAAYLMNADLSILEIGGGICLHRWFPVSKELTQPKNPGNLYLNKQGDSSYFTFSGIKLMARAALDPKRLFSAPLRDKFGKHDLRIYGEIAVLGVQDYPAYMAQVSGTDTAWIVDTARNFYGDISKRIPIMAGFGFPTCNMLDYLTLEIESYRWPEKNVYFDQGFQSENPRPPAITAVSKYTSEDYRYGQWKWSLNAKKSIVNGFSVIGQVARDHLRYDIYYEKNRDEEDAFTRSHEWYWMVRLNYAF
jgi:hypothetical protein